MEPGPASGVSVKFSFLGACVMHKEAGHQVETAVEARAGFLDRPVLVVLCVSTIVAALMLGGIWIGMAFLGGGGV